MSRSRNRPLLPMHWSIIGIGVCAFVGLVVSRSHYIPIWDSWVYGKCIVDAAEPPFAYRGLGCAGHFSHGYVALQLLFQRAGKAGMGSILFCNALIGIAGIVSVYSIARSMLPDPRYRLECALVSCAWAVHPMLLASAVFVNVDYAVGNFALVTLALLLRRRIVPCAIAGMLLVSSKEVGIAVFAILLGSFALASAFERHRSGKFTLGFSARYWWLALPLLTVLAYPPALQLQGAAWWGGLTVATILGQLLTWHVWTPDTLAMLAAVFVLNFSWWTSLVIVMGVIVGVGRWLVLKTASAAPGAHARNVSTVVGATVLVILVLTRIQTYVIVRYYFVFFPLLQLCALYACFRLALGRAFRQTLLLGALLLQAASTTRTIDPLSKRLYGTFRFGDHELLAMTSLNHECCGYGLDQLVYNLEFVHIHEAVEDMQVRVHPSKKLPLVVAESIDWYLMPSMDAHTQQRTLSSSGAVLVPHFEAMPLSFHPNPPREVWYLALPTLDNRGPLGRLLRRYRIVESQRFGRDGYWVPGYHLELKPPPF